MNLLIKAISFAAEKHRNQRRKDAEASPYINHPIALANVLANETGIEDEKALGSYGLPTSFCNSHPSMLLLIRAAGHGINRVV